MNIIVYSCICDSPLNHIFSSGNFDIESVVVKDADDVTICTINAIMDGTDEYDCSYNVPQTSGWEDALKSGYTLSATSISYRGKEYSINSVSVSGFYGGPPALETGYLILNTLVELIWLKLVEIECGMLTYHVHQ